MPPFPPFTLAFATQLHVVVRSARLAKVTLDSNSPRMVAEPSGVSTHPSDTPVPPLFGSHMPEGGQVTEPEIAKETSSSSSAVLQRDSSRDLEQYCKALGISVSHHSVCSRTQSVAYSLHMLTCSRPRHRLPSQGQELLLSQDPQFLLPPVFQLLLAPVSLDCYLDSASRLLSDFFRPRSIE